MDYKVFRMAILTIISAFVLVLVIVYATNADRINELLGKNKGDATAGEAASFMSSGGPFYGDQIGDNLDGFIYDEDFFDETEKVPSIVVIKENERGHEEADAAGSASTAEEAKEEDKDKKSAGETAIVGELTNESIVGNPTNPPIEGTPVGNASSN